ncbi:Phosphatidylinositol N-acetylglucosaminyltransferase [Leishmania donovani]|uniref:PhosphatidylinositolN-acetylglucosaminyltransfe_ra_sesubunit_c_-_putative n=3 Tax=Leishmania donovani species complex TaxID=38574 RepID=A0A6L0XWJ2_LEIIN|nr:putative phosphatidylinositolN-acetylglucosaminyltransfe ra sesubunit c [Leishmania infantum JPCM5]XP_003865294.1 phosphatidylinositolN-acetylglucosaminyltransfe ra sesubunit c, putative [Leishmania donovani]CAC9549853.1 phosphatidylinositolN-acetylglucosaminyltransfe_ra_sesubunit_c_-_putative [Leishmania infantum]AYU83524.1 phosphatidylinositolN-acetylglucosaminyltransfe ra sesubunit c, putative [Leishmania donovani]TPP42266.1 Phosphatidylinositol N-acetylglucosaminyltransferase family prot|eukprot:XP_001469761.1 putative phosphatidylinositolN-acetylglucosaminyltransfe ra sesubunit c [Leishmania infantum JPCM5]
MSRQFSSSETLDSSQQRLEAARYAASTEEESSLPESGDYDRRSPETGHYSSRPGHLQRVPSKQITSVSPSWRKVLYERQPFEDNYVDPQQFLEELSHNKDIKNYEYATVVINTLAITQEISIVVLFCHAFMGVFTNSIGKYSLLWIDVLSVLAALVCYVFYQCHQDACKETAERPASLSTRCSPPPRQPSRWLFHAWNFGRQVVSLVTMLALLSPIFSTLTVTYSDDTIVTLSILTMSLHVLLTDYSYLNAYTQRFDPNLSVNMAIYCVTLMASRISSPLASGALICFGIMCFSLSPIVRHLVKHYSFTAHVAITFGLVGLAIGCLTQIPILAILYTVTVLMISFGIPWLFVRMHSSVKTQINGPWDEAKPTNSAAAAEWANSGFLA